MRTLRSLAAISTGPFQYFPLQLLLLLSPCLLVLGATTTTTTPKIDLPPKSRLLNIAVCPVRSSVDVQAEYVRYPICLETRWVVGALPGSGSGQTGNNGTAVPSSTSEVGDEPTPTDSASTGPQGSQAEASADADTDSPLDNANFLSFEEWKKLNLAKVGQSAENVGGYGQGAGGAGAGAGGSEKKRRPEGINNALDAMGEEGEMELEFGGFAGNEGIGPWKRPSGSQVDPASKSTTTDGEEYVTRGTEGEVQSEGISRGGSGSRRKDAGTTCKERFNYASFDCAATVLKTNPQCTGSSSVLIENKDSYMLNECRAKNKFLILELCDDILVDTVVIANYEFFSSIFRTFRVSVTDRYPAKPDKWKELGTYEAANTREVQAFAVENPLIWARYVKIEFLTHYGKEFYCPVSLIRVHGTTMMEEYKNEGDAARTEEEVVSEDVVDVDDQAASPPGTTDVTDAQEMTEGRQGDAGLATERCRPQRNFVEGLLLGYTPIDVCPTQVPSETLQNRTAIISQSQPNKKADEASVAAPQVATANTTSAEAAPPADTLPSNSTESESRTQQPSQDSGGTSSSGTREPEIEPSTETTKTATATTQQQPPPSPNPTTQESFFKSVNKRLQMLETNSSLSLLYIEEQSRILRDAFNKVEKRQLAKASNFLENLNTTVLHELREFRQQYENVWHSVVIDFEQQRQQYHRELFDVTAQMGILADELVFQKRVTIIQSIFVLICFGLVLFSRGAVGTYLEFPRVQSFVSRSQSFRSASPSYESPSASPSPQKRRSSINNSYHHHNQHQRHSSDETQGYDDNTSVSEPMLAYSAPTPPVSDIASTRSDADEKGPSSGPGHTRSEDSVSSTSNSVTFDPDLRLTALSQRGNGTSASIDRAGNPDADAASLNPS